MSGIITIEVEQGTYNCRECLEDAIKQLSLADLKIKSTGTHYCIASSVRTQDEHQNLTRNRLNQRLTEINSQILPAYTLNHAKHTLRNKGFHYKNKRAIIGGYRLFFEKLIGNGRNTQRLTYQIDVLPNENRIIVEAGAMPELTCRSYLKDFEKGMGKVISFTRHKQATQRNTTRNQQYTRSNVRQKMKR
ncbi:MAG: hypothetical protein K9W44_10825 [Candidatus Lokiarchaeota archaeon]|nr:hypothetical protein [Candidatus Harpocratesius repetitus]